MKEQMITKAELLSRLSEIYEQLEELEDVLHSSYLEKHGEIHMKQKNRVNDCTNSIANMELQLKNVLNKDVAIDKRRINHKTKFQLKPRPGF